MGPMTFSPRAGRLPAPGPDDLDDATRAVYDAIVTGPRAAKGIAETLADSAGRLQGPFNAMVNASPGVGGALQHLGTEIRYGSALPDPARELAILTVAAHRRSEFIWLVHAPLGAAAGLSDDALESVARGAGDYFSSSVDADAALVHGAAIELVAGRDLSQNTYEKLADLLGSRGVVDLVILVGYYDTLALLLRAFRAPLPGDADPAW